jgi:polar amino acid transport system substrate-binding protein
VTAPDLLADLAPTGVLRAAINLGNPVLAQGTVDAPAGVTVDLSREIAARLDVSVSFVCVDAARKSFEALRDRVADIAFLAIDPAREAEVAFTAPYVVIEGVYAVPDSSPITSASDVDRPGVRIGVTHGSAYDLFLSRTLADTEIIRGPDATDVFTDQGLEVLAGVRQPLARYVAEHPGLRLLEPRFMEIRQAVGTRKDRTTATIGFLREVVESVKASGFVEAALVRSGQEPTVAAPA